VTAGLLAAAWLVLALVPLGWWLRSRRRVDVWRALPVPAALVDQAGSVRGVAGPPPPEGFAFHDALTALPARDRVVRLRTPGGIPLAATGVRGGALVLALPADPLREHRDRLLADLGARLAHDINTPLAALVGHLDLLAHETLSPSAASSVHTCQRELVRLQTTTSDLLTLTRLRANPGPRRVCLAGALMEDAASAFLDQADALGVELSVEIPTERVVVEVAEADLVRALRNLVANALRHGIPADTKPTGDVVDIVVSVDTEPDAVVFSVADRGPGLDPADLPRLCDPLVRGPDVHGEGSGLGLAIVAEVLTGHGAALTSSPRPGGGSLVSFALPRSA
jgi:signal transduction histidine kinase